MSERSSHSAPRRGPVGGHGPGGGMVPGEKAKDFKGSIGRLLNYMGRYKIALVFIVLFAIGSAAFSVVGPKIMGQATTEIFNGLVGKIGGTGGINFALIATILLTVLVIYVASALFSFVQSWLMTGISQKMAYRMRREISEKINRMPMKYFESRTVGEVLSRITNDVDTMGQSLNQSVTQLITSVTTIIGVVIMMLTISPIMTLIAFVILPISMLLIGVVVKHSQTYFQAQQKYLGIINGQVEEVYSGHNVVKAFNREDEVKAEFDSTNKVLFHSAWKSQFLSGMMQPIMQFVGNLGYVAVAIAGSVLAVGGVITVGDIQAFIQYVRSFTQPITQMTQVFNMLQSMAAAAERVFEFLDEAEERQTGSTPTELIEARKSKGEACSDQMAAEDLANWTPPVVERLEGAVSFEHVKFGYDPEKIIIHDFSTRVEPGKMVAIVGPTGAGKTTMVKLLMRFYDVNGGAIKVDGHDVREFKRDELREAFGMVLQDTWLFKGTIMENIRYGRLDASDDEVYAAAKAAHVHHFIQTLPGGYTMELSEDASNISQGQKQLLTIARAILADNKILILDEATSSVDTRTEHLIQDAMANLMKGRTSFVIAHRLSTIKDADLILVMKDGDIIEQGNHEELLARGGFYAELYNSQFEEVAG